MKKVAIYVDGQNLWHVARHYGRRHGAMNAKVDYEKLIGEMMDLAQTEFGVPEFEVVRQIAYCVSRKRALRFSTALSHLGYEVKDHILRSDTDDFDWDTEITRDALRDAPMVDLVIIVSGDGDLTPALEGSIAQGTEAIGVGFEGFTSTRFNRVHHLDSNVLYNEH